MSTFLLLVLYLKMHSKISFHDTFLHDLYNMCLPFHNINSFSISYYAKSLNTFNFIIIYFQYYNISLLNIISFSFLKPPPLTAKNHRLHYQPPQSQPPPIYNADSTCLVGEKCLFVRVVTEILYSPSKAAEYRTILRKLPSETTSTKNPVKN